MAKLTLVLFASFFISVSVLAQQKNPFTCLGDAEAESSGKSVGEIREIIQVKVEEIDSKNRSGIAIDPKEYCVVSELMKRVGDYRAPEYYQKAIDVGRGDPALNLFQGEYWRNFRGAQNPVFYKAEEQYFEALRKLNQVDNRQPFYQVLSAQIERGLVALYQKDGVPLLHYTSDGLKRPFLFFTTVFNAARNTSDFDRRSEVRDFTSESVLIEQRLSRSLRDDELQSIIRAKDQYESFNRLRFRYKGSPAVDFTYKYREIKQAQITNFFEPDKLNDVNLSEYGVAVEKPFDARAFDLFLRGEFKRARRVGTIEFLPKTKEDINQVEANVMISRFVGPDKANFEFVYVFQDINEDRANPLKRNRAIYAGKFTYQLFRRALQRVYKSRFDARGIDLFGGAQKDSEVFGVADVTRSDYFIGASFKGIGRFDVTVQPTVFTFDVENAPSQKNSQFRINTNVLLRIVDEDRRPLNEQEQPGNPGFLHLLFPFSRDVAMSGPNGFENYKVGVGLNAKLFNLGAHRITFLTSGRYDFQNFHKLGKRFHLFSLNFSMGF